MINSLSRHHRNDLLEMLVSTVQIIINDTMFTVFDNCEVGIGGVCAQL